MTRNSDWRAATSAHKAARQALKAAKQPSRGRKERPDLAPFQHALIDATTRVCELQRARIAMPYVPNFDRFEQANRNIGFQTAHELAEQYGTDEAAEEESIQAECDRAAGR